MLNSKIPPAPEYSSEMADSLGYLTRVTSRAFSRCLERRTVAHGVSAGQWPFLRALWKEEGITQRELSRRVGAREPTTVATLNRMEKAGFVRRKTYRTDRRKVCVFLTAKGRRLKGELMPCVAAVNGIATYDLGDTDIQLLKSLLLRVSNNLSRDESSFRAS